METKDHFDKIYWFVVGICFFAAALSLYVVMLDARHIDMVLTFWLTSGSSSCIGYLIGNSVQNKKQNTPGTATVDISATTSTDAKTE